MKTITRVNIAWHRFRPRWQVEDCTPNQQTAHKLNIFVELGNYTISLVLLPLFHLTNKSTSFSRKSMSSLQFQLGMCLPQSCSPTALTSLLNRFIPEQIKDIISVNITEQLCQFEEFPLDFRPIDWAAM